MSEDLLLQFMHEAAKEHATPSISMISFWFPKRWLGGSGDQLSASFCDFSDYKCTKKKKETESSPPKIRQVSDEDENEKPKVWHLCSLQKNKNRGYVRASAQIWMFLFGVTTSEKLIPLIFTLRSCRNDAHGPVFSVEQVVRHSDYDLLIPFLWKDRSMR